MGATVAVLGHLRQRAYARGIEGCTTLAGSFELVAGRQARRAVRLQHGYSTATATAHSYSITPPVILSGSRYCKGIR